jgi:hypothetical protein
MWFKFMNTWDECGTATDGGGLFLQNIGEPIADYVSSFLWTQCSSEAQQWEQSWNVALQSIVCVTYLSVLNYK